MRIMLGLLAALAVVPLLFFYADAVGSAGTLAISSSTICGISASTFPRTIYCTDIDESVSTTPYLVYPNVSFDSVSAGTNFFCGLKSSRKVFYCWNGNPVNRRRVYRGSWVLSDLTVGETQVSALDRSGNEIRWWRKAGLFPSSVLGNYSSLTSGNNFTCAITTNGTITCWGPLAGALQAVFSNYSMNTIVAGDSHMCGLDSSGFVICQGSNSSGQCYTPTGSPYEYTRFALGSNHTCAIMQPNYTAVCWGNNGGAQLYQPLNGTTFEFLVAGGNLTCGLTTHTYSVLCWGTDWTNVSVRKLPLPMILPGICVADSGDECNCGTYPRSQTLCNGNGVICQQCDLRKPIPPSRPPALAPTPTLAPTPALAPTPSESKKTSMTGWKLDAIFALIIAVVLLCVAAICLWVCCCKAPNSGHGGGNNNAPAGGVGNNNAPAGGGGNNNPPAGGGGNNNAGDGDNAPPPPPPSTASSPSISFDFEFDGIDEDDHAAEIQTVFPRLEWFPGSRRLGRLWYSAPDHQSGDASSSNDSNDS